MTRCKTALLLAVSCAVLACKKTQSTEPVDAPGEDVAINTVEELDAQDLDRGALDLDEPNSLVPPETTVVIIDATLAAACGNPEYRIFFDFDSHVVREVGKDKLEGLADCLNEFPLEGKPITITGHADPRGSKFYNLELGLDRADAVAEILVKHGLDAERVDTYSRGEYLASGDPEDWAEDRRVVIRLDR